MRRLLDLLLGAPLDDSRSHLHCVLDACASPTLLALSRCSWHLHIALAPLLQRAEETSEDELCAHFGMERTHFGDFGIEYPRGSLARRWQPIRTITSSGLPYAQCRHVGTWMQKGGPLEGVATVCFTVCFPRSANKFASLAEDLRSARFRVREKERTVELDLLQFRSEETRLISLHHEKLDDETLIILVHAMGALGSLQELWLHHNQIGDAGVSARAGVCAIGALANLTNLSLADNLISDTGVSALASACASGALRSLTILDLQSNKISDPGMIAFSEASEYTGSLGALQDLRLWGNQIGDEGMKAFSAATSSGSLRALRELDLGGNKIGDAGLIEFSRQIASGSTEGLKALCISGNPGKTTALKAACSARLIMCI